MMTMHVPRLDPRRVTAWAVGAACTVGLTACGAHAIAGTSAAIDTSPSATTAAPGAGPGRARTQGPGGNWLEFGDNIQHSGVGPADTGITAANLRTLTVRPVRINGIADSAAVELHAVWVRGRRRDLVAVTTSYGATIALDPGTGGRLWEFDPRGVNSRPGNPQVTTATPAVDPNRRYLYTASPNGVIHKLAVATGRQLWATSVTYDPVREKIASALTVSGPHVVVLTGGYYGDAPPYDGHVVTIDRATGRIAHVWNSECSDRHLLIRASSCLATASRGDNAMWSRAGAIIEPGSGRILTATGNGPFNGSTSWGDSVLELAPDATTLLHHWTPTNQAYLQANDLDVGSTSPALLPTFHGWRLAVQGGKAGRLDVLNLAALNGTTAGPGRRLGGQVSETSTPDGAEILTQPAVWVHGGTIYVFVGSDHATAGYRVVDPARPRLQRVWQIPSQGTSPVVAGGLLYTYDPNGTLYIQQPQTGRVLRAISVATGHWESPIVVGGRVVLPTGDYHSSAASSTVEILHLPGR